jgi:hypothetical protein
MAKKNKMPIKQKERFVIDFFEFAFLVCACIPPNPIARAMFWQKTIDYYYNLLTTEERNNLYEWVMREYAMKKGLEEKNEDCMLWEARFNPSNQYFVHTSYNGNSEDHPAFLYNGRYCISTKASILEQYILGISKI